MFPQILIIAYNRPESLKRLLDSIAFAKFTDKNIDLIISIDGSNNIEVKNVAEVFEWKYGNKAVIIQTKRLGLKKHVQFACDNAAMKGAFIVLEDDLSVSPFFYDYSVSALNYFSDDKNIAGLSLYSYSIAESCLSPFSPLEDGFDNYFIRFPSSWGQCFTAEQWKNFRDFDPENETITSSLPPYINDWRSESWKKDFAAFLILQNKYFIFPKTSLATNFAEKGTNFPFKMDIFQVPLQTVEKEYKFQKFQLSQNKFDEYFELLQESMKHLLPEISDLDFAVDIYGTRDISSVSEELVLTTRKTKNEIKNFGKKLKFQKENVGLNDIVLSHKLEISGKIRKPDFGASIFFHKNKNRPDSLKSKLLLFQLRFYFLIGNTLHWVKKYFTR